MSDMGVVLTIAVVCGLIGALIGERHGKKWVGAGWGFLFGPIGLLVFVLFDRGERSG